MLDSEIQEREELYKVFNTRHVLKEKERPLMTLIKERLEDLWYEYYTKPILIPIKNFFGSLKAVIDYFPVICKDRDWDQAFLYELIAFKLKRMRLHVEKCKIGHTKKEARKIKVCEFLFKRLSQDDYYPDYEMFPKMQINELPLAYYKQEEDLNMATRYLAKYSRGWWC